MTPNPVDLAVAVREAKASIARLLDYQLTEDQREHLEYVRVLLNRLLRSLKGWLPRNRRTYLHCAGGRPCSTEQGGFFVTRLQTKGDNVT